MNYELEFFSKMVRTGFELSELPLSDTDSQYIEKIATIKKEVSEAKDRMMRAAISGMSPQHMQDYITYHQADIIRLADVLIGCLHPDHIADFYECTHEPIRLNLCKKLYQALEDLLTFIESFFSTHFNQEAYIPEGYRLLAVRRMEQQYTSLRSGLQRLGVEEELLSLTLSPVDCFLHDPSKKRICFRSLIYLKELLRVLERILSESPMDQAANDALFDALCYLNFNSHSFYLYIVGRCKKELELAASPAERHTRLAWLVKKSKQHSMKEKMVLWTSRKSIRAQVLGWLKNEKGYTKIKDRNYELEKYSGSLTGASPAYKLPLALTIGQLAWLIRKMVRCGIIPEPHLPSLFDFFASHFLARNHTPITASGLRTRYMTPEQYSINAVRDHLFAMLKDKE